jgi:hypothetical protein
LVVLVSSSIGAVGFVVIVLVVSCWCTFVLVAGRIVIVVGPGAPRRRLVRLEKKRAKFITVF